MRQCVESAGLHAAGDEVIARAFGRGASHERSFDFEETLVRKIISNGLCDFVTGLDIELHHVTAQIDVAIFQARLFVGERGIGRQEWWQLRFIEDAQFFGDQFDLARGHVFVDSVRIA